ncbi:hypothetical protein Taro_028712 [Colocasia esculenta]|uniref:Uncharacterized protein n=1 Tax=Colocasia esculenta TaxID=4460 RepID=A0A843VJB5_COLES|nr:hypothetical protein [Colocasia esculenta]
MHMSTTATFINGLSDSLKYFFFHKPRPKFPVPPPPRQIPKSLRPLPPSVHSPFRAPSSTSSAPSSSSPAVGTGAPSPFCASILVCRWSLKKLKLQLQIASDAAKRRRLLRLRLAAAPVQVLLQQSPQTFPSSEPPSAKPEPTDQTRKATGPLTYPNKGGVEFLCCSCVPPTGRSRGEEGEPEERGWGAETMRLEWVCGLGGGGSTTVAAVHDGYVHQKAVATSPIGGEFLTECMMKCLENRGIVLKPRYSFKRKEVRPGEFQTIPGMERFADLASAIRGLPQMAIALAYSTQIMDSGVVPVTPHDVSVDALVSPSGVVPMSTAALERM